MRIYTIKHNPTILLWLAILIYIVGFCLLSLWKLSYFYYDNLDLAIFNQVFWNSLHGDWFASSIHPASYLADHFAPIIVLLLPFYALKPGPQILLILQVSIIALSAWPIHLIANKVFKFSDSISLWIAILWLLNPMIHNMTFFEFHLLPFAVFFILWAIYFYMRKKFAPYILFISLALLVREDIALTIFIFSIIAWLDKRELKWKLTPALCAVSYILLSFGIISSTSTQGSYKFLTYYSWLGGTNLISIIISYITHPIKVFLHFFSWTNLEFILGAIFPFFFFIFYKSKYWLLLIIPAAQVFLSANGGSAIILQTHYGAYFVYALFLVFMIAVLKIQSHQWPKIIPDVLRNKKMLYTTITAATIYAALTYGTLIPLYNARAVQNLQKEKNSIIALIPPNASVAATFELLTPLSSRSNIYSFHYAYIGRQQFNISEYQLPSNVAYLAIDWHDIVKMQMHFDEHHTWGAYADNLSKNLRRILTDFEHVTSSGSISLWQRNDIVTDRTTILIKPNYSIFSQLSHVSLWDNADQPDPYITEIKKVGNGIQTEWRLPIVAEKNAKYYIEIKTARRKYNIPLAYGLYTGDDWKGMNNLNMFISIDDNESNVEITLYKWHEGFLKIGSLKNLEAVSDAEIVGEPFMWSNEI